ncbi:signal peptidase I [Cryobacterium sp. MLB-32]|uniref:signal peptidase I n=1 Tax=Cryobacterium sp. MLB-32 TaxID=1529318 RepID=UPI0009DFF7F4|nr:signal peptidase I [Cryobacterium sp. MLB-32]
MTTRMHPPGGVGAVVGNALLTLAAIGGVICILLVAAAFLFDVTLVMFKTGSMSPQIPAGSVAVVREIPAAEIQVGDVVTVSRGDAPPITHRVVSVTAGPSATERVITLKGDANVSADPQPYTVSSVRRVLGSVPGLARVVVWFSNPLVLGTLALGAAALVTWAFWPRNDRGVPVGNSENGQTGENGRRAQAGRAGQTSRTGRNGGDVDAGGNPRTGRRARAGRNGGTASRPKSGVGEGNSSRAEPSLRRRPLLGIRRPIGPGVLHVLGGAIFLALLLGAPAMPVAAALVSYDTPPPDLTPDHPTENRIAGGGLTLYVVGDQSQMHSMDPDGSVLWQVGVATAETDPGDVHVRLSGTGSANLSLYSVVRSCAERFVGSECLAGATLVQPASAVAVDGVERALGKLSATETRWFLFELWRHDTTVSRNDDSVSLALHAFGSSDSLSTASGRMSGLPRTGVDALAPLWAAFGAIGLGLLVAGGAGLGSRLRGRP